MRRLCTLIVFFVSTATFAATPCITFNNEDYCLAWASVNGAMTINEYLRSGETVEAWTLMVTVKEYGGTTQLKDVIPVYMTSIQPLLVPAGLEVYSSNEKKHTDDIVMQFLLLAPDKSHFEIVTHRVYVDEGGPVRSVIFSARVPFENHVFLEDAKKRHQQGALTKVSGVSLKEVWLKEIMKPEPRVFSKVPAPSDPPMQPTPDEATGR